MAVPGEDAVAVGEPEHIAPGLPGRRVHLPGPALGTADDSASVQPLQGGTGPGSDQSGHPAEDGDLPVGGFPPPRAPSLMRKLPELSSVFTTHRGAPPSSSRGSRPISPEGEYNVNYSFRHPETGQRLVLRLNTGSQMHLEHQIESKVLRHIHVPAGRRGAEAEPRPPDRCQSILVYALVAIGLPGKEGPAGLLQAHQDRTAAGTAPEHRQSDAPGAPDRI